MADEGMDPLKLGADSSVLEKKRIPFESRWEREFNLRVLSHSERLSFSIHHGMSLGKCKYPK